MTTAQIDEIWHAHCATTEAVTRLVSARTEEAKAKACESYQRAERRFYRAWLATFKEADAEALEPDPVAESLDREQVEVAGR